MHAHTHTRTHAHTTYAYASAPDKPYNCGAACYDAKRRRKFWGFVSCVINLDALAKGSDPRLAALRAQGYHYELLAAQPNGTLTPFAVSANGAPPRPPASVVAAVPVPFSKWELRLSPADGWAPSWRDPVLAAVVVAASLIGLLVGAVLVGRFQARRLLRETRAANGALAEEKRRMDALLARQYNLLEVLSAGGGLAAALGSGSGTAGGGSGGPERSGASAQEKALARIEDMRRSIGVAAPADAAAGADEVQLLELLGEGSFGKVYKAIWRGTTVAVKSMLLPASMSGTEKRERMAIMEAAISSALSHPNVVQTFTYSLSANTIGAVPQGVELSGSYLGGSTAAAAAAANGGNGGGGASGSFAARGRHHHHVHSFAVSLVIEFCDLGCLRDALDAGAFFTTPGNALNYAAILETAADVAKAMLHLHARHVVHSDLKCRNVLLKSDGAAGRGATAKVADFGLAQRLDAHDTHISALQGTLSHMAPEAQLGRVSKAGDVYSFGVTLWELFTGGHAFAGVPRALLGHRVAVQGLRPVFPPFCPAEYRALAEACWAADPDARCGGLGAGGHILYVCCVVVCGPAVFCPSALLWQPTSCYNPQQRRPLVSQLPTHLSSFCPQSMPTHAPDDDRRPTFDAVLERLQAMRARLGGATPPLTRYTPKPHVSGDDGGSDGDHDDHDDDGGGGRLDGAGGDRGHRGGAGRGVIVIGAEGAAGLVQLGSMSALCGGGSLSDGGDAGGQQLAAGRGGGGGGGNGARRSAIGPFRATRVRCVGSW